LGPELGWSVGVGVSGCGDLGKAEATAPIPTPTLIKFIFQAHIRSSGAPVVAQRLVANTRLTRIILQLS